jgi:hypothetical protein
MLVFLKARSLAHLEASGGRLGDGVSDGHEVLVEGELGGNVGQGVAGCLGGEGRGSREASVHLDDAVALGFCAGGARRIFNEAKSKTSEASQKN